MTNDFVRTTFTVMAGPETANPSLHPTRYSGLRPLLVSHIRVGPAQAIDLGR
jgi:hypothetical protein